MRFFLDMAFNLDYVQDEGILETGGYSVPDGHCWTPRFCVRTAGADGRNSYLSRVLPPQSRHFALYRAEGSRSVLRLCCGTYRPAYQPGVAYRSGGAPTPVADTVKPFGRTPADATAQRQGTWPASHRPTRQRHGKRRATKRSGFGSPRKRRYVTGPVERPEKAGQPAVAPDLNKG